MGKIVVTEVITPDGVIEDLGGAERTMLVHPVVLGAGERLFGDHVDLSSLKLVEARQTGAVGLLVLRRAA